MLQSQKMRIYDSFANSCLFCQYWNANFKILLKKTTTIYYKTHMYTHNEMLGYAPHQYLCNKQ